MGTRADFYVGRGPEAEWLGSIAMDGYPDGLRSDKYPSGKRVLAAAEPQAFREAVAAFLKEKGDQATTPDLGWPWPWDDSRTTDYAYALDGGRVWASCFGHEWFDPNSPEPEDSGEKVAVFPDMKGRKSVTFGPRSGLIVCAIPK